VNLQGSIVSGAIFNLCTLLDATMAQLKAKNASFHRANLTGANLAGANAGNADFRGSVLRRVNFFHTHLANCRMQNADVRGAKLDLSIVCKRGWMCGVRFGAVDWSGKDLKNAKLQGCHFENAKLSDLRWQGADLSDAIFDNCDLRRSNLSNACLENAIVNSTDFSGAIGVDKTILKEARRNYLMKPENRKPIQLRTRNGNNQPQRRPASAISHFTRNNGDW